MFLAPCDAWGCTRNPLIAGVGRLEEYNEGYGGCAAISSRFADYANCVDDFADGSVSAETSYAPGDPSSKVPDGDLFQKDGDAIAKADERGASDLVEGGYFRITLKRAKLNLAFKKRPYALESEHIAPENCRFCIGRFNVSGE